MVRRLCETELERSYMATPVAEVVLEFLSRTTSTTRVRDPSIHGLGNQQPDPEQLELFDEMLQRPEATPFPGLAILRCWALPLVFETSEDLPEGKTGSPFRLDRFVDVFLDRDLLRGWIAQTFRNKVVPYARTMTRGDDVVVEISLVSEFEKCLGEVVLAAPSPDSAEGNLWLFPHLDGCALSPSDAALRPGETAVFNVPARRRKGGGSLSIGMLTPHYGPANVAMGKLL